MDDTISSPVPLSMHSVLIDFPQRYLPDAHFVGNFADITYSRFHSTLDPRSATRTYFKGIVEQWGKLAKAQDNPLWFYGYNWNLCGLLYSSFVFTGPRLGKNAPNTQPTERILPGGSCEAIVDLTKPTSI